MNNSSKKFIFSVVNIEEIYLEISRLKQFNDKKLNCFKIECIDKNFPAPIEDVFINISLDTAKKNLALLGIIKKKLIANSKIRLEISDKIKNFFKIKSEHINGENYLLTFDENNHPEFTVRNIENFGIYIFAGRLDMGHYEYNSPGISLNNLENFKYKFEKFAKLVELLVNEIYKLNNVELENNIEYKLILNKTHKETELFIENKKELPEALKRFYARIGNE